MLSKKLGRSFGRQIIGVALLLAAGFVFFVLQPDFALAQIDTSSADTTAATAELADAELTTIISNIIFGLLGFLGVIFLVIVIYAGFLWMTAGGDEDQITKAKKWIINGVIGLLIIMAAYAITTFIINVLTGQFAGGGAGGSGDDGANNGQQVSAPALSGSLGRGIITHRPYRNEQDVVRNTSISVTFADEMDPASFIQGYDPTAANPAGDLNTNNVKIYETEQGENRAYESDEVRVTFTDDKKIFTFYPPLLGSSLEDTNISVFLAPMIENANEENVLDQDGYLWTFTVGTELDLTPPRIVSVLPAADGQYGRNIAVQMTFSEPVDPTSASGAFDPAVSEADFDNIKAVGANSGDLAGEYFISNEYRTVTFLTNDSCGTNSCGQEMFCLPANETVTMTIYGATPAANQNDWPASSGFPFDGVVDMAGNSFDGDGNWGDPEGGDIGDEY